MVDERWVAVKDTFFVDRQIKFELRLLSRGGAEDLLELFHVSVDSLNEYVPDHSRHQLAKLVVMHMPLLHEQALLLLLLLLLLSLAEHDQLYLVALVAQHLLDLCVFKSVQII